MNEIAVRRSRSIMRKALLQMQAIEVYEASIHQILRESRFDDESPYYQAFSFIDSGELASKVCIPDGFDDHGPIVGKIERFSTVGRVVTRNGQPYFEFAPAAKRLRKIDRFMLRRTFKSLGFAISFSIK